MNYFKLNPNVTSKKWEGYVNLGGLFYKGEEVDDVELSNSRTPCAFEPLHYEILLDGKTAPVNTIVAEFFVFDEALQGLDNFADGACAIFAHQPRKTKRALSSSSRLQTCRLRRLGAVRIRGVARITCGQRVAKSKRSFLFQPNIKHRQNPKKTEVFRLEGWGGAFNIVICEAYKNKLQSFDFDHSLLEFHPIILV